MDIIQEVKDILSGYYQRPITLSDWMADGSGRFRFDMFRFYYHLIFINGGNYLRAINTGADPSHTYYYLLIGHSLERYQVKIPRVEIPENSREYLDIPFLGAPLYEEIIGAMLGQIEPKYLENFVRWYSDCFPGYAAYYKGGYTSIDTFSMPAEKVYLDINERNQKAIESGRECILVTNPIKI